MTVPSGDSKPQKSLNELCMEEILPTAMVQEETLMDLVYIIPRIVCRYLPAYSIFQKSIVHHIPHTFSQEMTQRSEKVHCTEFPAKILFLEPFKPQYLHTNSPNYTFPLRIS